MTWGISSIRTLRMKRPTRVTRSSAEAAQRATPSCSASVLMAWAAVAGAPLSVARFRHPMLERWIEDVLREVRPDVVFVFSSAMCRFRTRNSSRVRDSSKRGGATTPTRFSSQARVHRFWTRGVSRLLVVRALESVATRLGRS